jgi:hypothetical protein
MTTSSPALPRALVAPGIALWMLLACVTAGAIAEWARFPSLWGGGSVFASYAVPLWIGWGMFHVPGLVVGAGALALSARGRAAVLPLALGALAAGAIMAWDMQFQSFRPSPWALYLLVDGAWLLVFATFWRSTGSALPRTRLSLMAFAMPVAAAIVGQAGMQAHLVTWRPATSHWDAGTQLETLELYPSAQRALPASAAEGCAILAKLAPDPYPGQGGPDGWPKRHRVLNMHAEPVGARRPGSENPVPVLRYEWWPDRAEGQCDSSRFPAR